MMEFSITFQGESGDLSRVLDAFPDDLEFTHSGRKIEPLVSPPAPERIPTILAIASLERQYEEVLKADTQLTRNRRAIELHSKLDRLAQDLDEDPMAAQEDKDRLAALIDRLLTDVFQIAPKT